ncbi:MAG: rhomboid family intramembrane serine protease [Bacilli bacterium]|nr:rhomboid family intramembrane serine protease [Bacilli bacterium]
MNIKIDKKDDIILKILHYFITEEDYKPVIINGLDNEIWLENMENDLQLIRINTNYIHNDEQLKNDMYKVKTIMRSIKKNTLSLRMNVLNLLLDTNEDIDFKSTKEYKNVETIKVEKISDFKRNKVVTSFFPKVKDNILNDKMDPIDFFKLTDDMNQKTIKNEKKLAKIFSQKKPIVTYVLIVLNVMIFLLSQIYPKLVGMFGNNYMFIQSRQIYRLITSMFLHGGIMHLLFNMYALYILGSQVERYYGKRRFLLIYFLSGLMGSLFSCVFMKTNVFGVSIGASGAIFGLMGSIAYFTYYYRATLQGVLREQIMPVIVLNLLLGMMIQSIDLFAHIGGLIGGLLISMAIGIGDKGRKSDQINGIIVFILMIIYMFYMTMIK